MTTIEIPDILSGALVEWLGEKGAKRWILETLVLAALRVEWLSLDLAAEFLGLSAGEASALLAARGLPPKSSPPADS